MNTSGITAALPAQDLSRAKAFYAEKVGLQALESDFLKARDGQVGLTVGEGVSQLFVFPARVRSSGEFTQAVIHVADVRAAVEEMRGRGVEFEEYDTPETRTENGIARVPGGPPRRVVYLWRLVQAVPSAKRSRSDRGAWQSRLLRKRTVPPLSQVSFGCLRCSNSGLRAASQSVLSQALCTTQPTRCHAPDLR
jgi:predicted enzyme related to lactoylglutathione lyase